MLGKRTPKMGNKGLSNAILPEAMATNPDNVPVLSASFNKELTPSLARAVLTAAQFREGYHERVEVIVCQSTHQAHFYRP